MPADQSSDQPVHQTSSGIATISASKRRQLQACFVRGNEVLKQDSENPDRDYAHTMFAACVLEDPSNLEYVSAMLDNLQRKYKNNKRGTRFAGFGGRGAFKKAVADEDWQEIFRLGLDLLKTNPWDVSALRALAYACKANHYNEVELRYLKNALDVNAKDPQVCKHCAESLARMGQFDQAIALWHRIEELDKKNVEARRMVSELTLAKQRGGAVAGIESTSAAAAQRSIATSGQDQSSPKNKPPSRRVPSPAPSATVPSEGTQTDADAAKIAGASHAGESSNAGPNDATSHDTTEPTQAPLAMLEAAAAREEATPDDYIALSDAYAADGKLREAFQTLKRGLDSTGGTNLRLLEKMEDAQIRMVRGQVAIAEAKAAREKSPESEDLVKRFRSELNRQEIQILSGRSDRYPEDATIRFELGVRLKRDGNYRAAKQAFEQARQSPELKAVATLELGECLQHLKQYSNALKCYQAAGRDAEDRSETQKLCLFRTGVLASALKDLETAESAFQRLVELDPEFRDAAARLDKVRQIGNSDELG